MRRCLRSLLVMSALLLAPAAAHGAPGDLDATFAGDGSVVEDLFGTSEHATAIVARPLPESGYIVAGYTNEGYSGGRRIGDFVVARYGPDGTPDPTFGTNGKVRHDLGPDSGDGDYAPALAVQPDGRMLVGGSFLQADGQRVAAVMRLLRNGSLDATFDGDGKATVGFPDGEVTSLSVLPGDKIAAFGNATYPETGEHLAAARLLPDGTPDGSFGGDGVAHLDLGSDSTAITPAGGIAQGDGKLVVAGSDTDATTGPYFLTARFKTDGSLDTSWSADGWNKSTFTGGGAVARSVALQPDGKIVVGGGWGETWKAARYQTTGGHDAGFSGDGKATLPVGAGGPVIGARIAVTATTGRVVFAGAARTGTLDPETEMRDLDMIVGQLKADGYPDADFGGGDGVRTYGLGAGSDDMAGAVAATGGRIVVAGETVEPGPEGEHDLAVLRMVGASEDTPPPPPAGSLDPTFSGDGLNRTVERFWSIESVARMPATGRLVVGGYGSSMTNAAGYGSGYTNHHFSRFGPGGAYDAENFASQECTGTCETREPLYRAAGDLIVPGIQHVGANDVAVQPGGITDGRIVAAGSRGGTCGAAILRIAEHGEVDTTFGPTGDGFSATYEGCEARTDWFALATRPDGRIIAVGGVGPGWGGYVRPLIAQYNADGSLDTGGGSNDSTPGDGFGTGGLVEPNVSSCCAAATDVVRLPDGRIVVAGNHFVLRLTATGALDTTFGTDGITVLPERSGHTAYGSKLFRQPDGKLLVGKHTWAAGLAVTRLNADGTLDTDFGSDGVTGIGSATGCTDADLGGLHVQADRKIVVGGMRGHYCEDGGGSVLARFHPDGSLDTTFGAAGKVLYTFPKDPGGNEGAITDMVGQPDGRLVVVGHDRTIARFHMGGMAPRNSARPAITGTLKENETLGSTTGSWSVTGVEFRRQWLRCTEQGADCEPIFTPSGDGRVMPETGPTYVARLEDVGRSVRVRVTAHKDGMVSSEVSKPALIRGHQLVLAEPPTVAGHPGPSQALTARAAFTGTEPRLEYQWLSCRADTGESCVEIYEATGRTYEIPASQTGNRLRVQVKATNYENSVTETSPPTDVVASGNRYAARPRWSAAPDFVRNPLVNPSPDASGAPIWHYMSGPNAAVPDPAAFVLLTNACCGYWGNDEPYFMVNAYPHGQELQLHPSVSSNVIGFKAPEPGVYRITGTIADDAGGPGAGDGVDYAVMKGAAQLHAGTLEAGGAERSFDAASLKAVSLLKNQFVYLAVRPRGDNGWDGTRARFAVEAARPSVAITSPAAGQQVPPRPTLSGRASSVEGDAATVLVKIYSGTAATGTPVRSMTATRSGTTWSVAPTTALPAGSYAAVAEQKDAAGAVGRSPTRTFKVVEPPNVAVAAGKLRWTGETGKANTVTIARSSTAFTVEDTGAPVRPGAGCSAVTVNRVTCTLTGVTGIEAAAGDGDDTVTVTGTTPAKLFGDLGDDALTGGSGADVIDGGPGGDVIAGGGGTDTASYATRTVGVTVDIDGVRDDGSSVDASAVAARDNLQLDVENLTGGLGSDTLLGSEGPNTFDGGAGGDIFGGAGGVDTVTYASRGEPITADIDGVRDDGSSVDANTVSARDSVRTDIENLTGGTGDDTLTAKLANAVVNILSGGLGNDTLKTRDGTATADRIFCGGGDADSYDRDRTDAHSLCETAVTIP